MAWADESVYAKECERKGYRYDYKKADKVCRFFENLTCTYGKFAGKPFELLGWQEPKVIVRFWIISVVLAILSIATLKIR